MEAPAHRWSIWRDSFDPDGRLSRSSTPEPGQWSWHPLLFGAVLYRGEGRPILAQDDGVRLDESRQAWNGAEAGGTLGLGNGIALDAAWFAQVRSDRPASGRLQELAVRWRDERYAASVGRTRLRWDPGHDGSLLAGRGAPPRWQLHGWTARPLRVPGTGTYWSGSSFLAYLDDERRVIADPLLFGQRISWYPRPWLELSGARTILFGGENRTGKLTLRDLWHIASGTRENLPGDERTLGDSDQRASAAIRMTVPGTSRVWSPWDRLEFFYEYAGEDMLHPPIPSAVAHHNGVALGIRGWSTSLEFLETVTGRNRWYSHIVYGPEAYAYRGYLLGIAQGGDSRALRISLWTPAAPVQARLTRAEERFGEYAGTNELRVTWEVAGKAPVGPGLVGEVVLARTRRIGPGVEPLAPGWFRHRFELRLSYQPGTAVG